MKLFVANCSQNYAVLNYRLLEVKNPLSQPVEAGQQVMIARPDLNLPQIEHFLEQMRAYGLMLVEEISTMDKGKVVQWMASIEKPMKVDKIRQVLVHNASALTYRGLEFRKAAAITANGKIQEYSPHAAGTMEITIQEESASNNSVTGDPLVAEGYRIDRGV